MKTLRPVREKSVDFDSTKNIYIEGDNLDVLKCLRETYLGKVKMIYIDPPYNTGNDFVYADDFKESIASYEQKSSLLDEEGNRLVANPETNGRFHTNWLNMIYPRLKVARDLLSEDGVLVASIDDHEIDNLKKVCNEIFGEMNFVATFPWRKRTAKSDVPFGVSQDYEWVVVYARSDKFIASTAGAERKYYTTDDFPGKPWRIHDLTKQCTASERPNSFFTIVDPKREKQYPANPNRVWCVTKETLDEYLRQNRIIFPGDYDFLNITRPQLRYWKEDDIQKLRENFGRQAVSTNLDKNVGMSKEGTKEISDLFGAKIFSFPKPSALIKFFVSILNDKNALVLDFFSGSATTAQAVMELNAEDGGNRRFIMVQLPEEIPEDSEAGRAGYKNICEIGRDRIRKSGQAILSKSENQSPIDMGFRAFRLDSSNMTEILQKPDEITQNDLFSLTDNIKPDRTPEDLLVQVMLSRGATLDCSIARKDINGRQVFFIEDNYLAACFDTEVTDDVIEAIAKAQPRYVVLRDACFASDSVADNFEQIFKTYAPNTDLMVI